MSETVLAAVEKVLAELGNFPKSGSPRSARIAKSASWRPDRAFFQLSGAKTPFSARP
jgi:hypothetical protein